MEWLIGIGLALVLCMAIPLMLKDTRKRQARRDGSGAVSATGTALMGVFEPEKAAAIEEIETRKNLDIVAQDESADDPAPTADDGT